MKTNDDRIIYLYSQEDAPTAAIFLTGKTDHYEIFGIEYAAGEFQADACRALLTAALSACKALRAKHITYFCKKEERPILHRLGFNCIGRYVLYAKTL